MKEQLEQRLAKLQAELKTGQQALAGINAQIRRLRETGQETTVTMHRIGGAIQVLEEELAVGEEPVQSDDRQEQESDEES